jgi:HD-GYP domain-containing protein (c-di-GMP phosphodiesterase class II)
MRSAPECRRPWHADQRSIEGLSRLRLPVPSKMEVIYDHSPKGMVIAGRNHEFSNFELREGSLEEIKNASGSAVVRLFITSPNRLRAFISAGKSGRAWLPKLRASATTGIFLIESEDDKLTVRLKKLLTEQGAHHGFAGYMGVLGAPFSYNDFTHAVISAAERLYLKCHENYFNSIAAIRDVETKAMHDLGSALTGNASAVELGKLVLDKCLSVSEADAGILLMSELLFEDPIPDGKTVKILGQVGDTMSERARRCLSQSVGLRDRYWNKNTDPVFACLSQLGRAIAWNEGLGFSSSVTIPAEFASIDPLKFEFAKDRYKVKNYCVVPIRVPSGDVMGAVVLVNRRVSTEIYLDNLEQCSSKVREISVSDLIMLEALAHQAGVSLDHARLIKNLKTVFESFVQASVVAIESRDPSTKGHSVRVATLTVALAEAVSAEQTGPLAKINFTPSQIYEIKYASLLHDFGKIGVREDVLQKEKKLFSPELAAIKERFLHLERQLYLRCIESYVDGLIRRSQVPKEEDLARVRREVDRVSRELRHFWDIIVEANEPQVVKGGNFQALAEIAAIRVLVDGSDTNILTQRELERLSIRKGSLSDHERIEIERHVTNSHKFLLQIPWTRELSELPDIVFGHHERLNGSGYPRQLKAPDIPLQAQIMAVCDIYDALIAMDRPYKKALPHSRAMSILEAEVAEGKLEPLFFNLFRDREIFKLVLDHELKVAS